ncbi:Phosphoesterase [Minicystis rosea]|nr:Phosphoesterase [Minicystis rosea]
MMPRFLLFGIAVLIVMGTASRYLLRRSKDVFRLGPRTHRALGVVVFASILVVVLSRMVEHRLPATLLDPLASVAFFVVLAVFVSTVLLAIVDIVSTTARFLRSRLPAPPRAGAAGDPSPLDHSPLNDPAPASSAPAAALPSPEAAAVPRRSFLAQAAAGSALAIGGGSSLYGSAIGRHDYALEEVPIRIPGLSRALDGFTIVQLSDVHLGLFVRDHEIRAAEELVRRARPDLVVLTGDLLDHDAYAADALGRMIARLSPLARNGVVAIPGNHDYYAGLDVVADTIVRAGARFLRNEGLVIGGAAGFALLGVDDVWGPRTDRRSRGPDLQRALDSVPASKDLPRILLCHNPVTFPQNAGRVALQLSGHTHGGQVNIGVRLADSVLGHPYIAGRYELRGSQIYVNRGFGTAGPPARVGAPPEVSRVVLVAG